MQEILFELLQVAIGNRRELTRSLSADEWAALRLEFKKQAMLGVGYCGIIKLPQEQTPPIQVLAQWVHNAEKIRKKNERVTAECVSLCEQLAHDGLNACILKGQSNLVNYQTPSSSPCLGGEISLADYRTPGDIDVLMRPASYDGIEIAEPTISGNGTFYEKYKGIRGSIEYAMMQCRLHDVEVGKICYHHMDMPFGNENQNENQNQNGKAPTPVEAHYRACWLSSPIRNHRLQKWLEDNMPFGQVTSPDGFPIPSNSYNAIFQLIHIFKHLFEEGIGLRQLLDYYFVLKTLPTSLHREGKEPDHMDKMMEWARSTGKGEISREEIMHQLKRFGLGKFASAVMYVLQEAFNMPDVYLLCKPNEKEGRFLLNEIMLAGNFGKYDDRIKHGGSQLSHTSTSSAQAHWEKTKHNLRLLTHYPEEVMWEPVFRVYHWLWRRFEWWRY